MSQAHTFFVLMKHHFQRISLHTLQNPARQMLFRRNECSLLRRKLWTKPNFYSCDTCHNLWRFYILLVIGEAATAAAAAASLLGFVASFRSFGGFLLTSLCVPFNYDYNVYGQTSKHTSNAGKEHTHAQHGHGTRASAQIRTPNRWYGVIWFTVIVFCLLSLSTCSWFFFASHTHFGIERFVGLFVRHVFLSKVSLSPAEKCVQWAYSWRSVVVALDQLSTTRASLSLALIAHHTHNICSATN